MKYLLDTHTAIWAIGNKDKLSESAKMIIDDVTIPLCASIVSAWEIAIKISIGKLKLPGGSSFFLNKMEENNIEILDIAGSYIKVVEDLPFHHSDPFDRLLVATAIVEDLTILTADKDIPQYNVKCEW